MIRASLLYQWMGVVFVLGEQVLTRESNCPMTALWTTRGTRSTTALAHRSDGRVHSYDFNQLVMMVGCYAMKIFETVTPPASPLREISPTRE